MTLQPGDPLPDLPLPATGGTTLSLARFKGRPVVVYFYPKDNTAGCTQEGQDFRDAYTKFQALKTEVVGISRDSIRSHQNFAAKHGFPFPLLSDAEERACRLFDVLREKTLYGRKYQGVDRSTFLFDAQGILRRVWRGVKVKGHVSEVLDAVRGL